MAQTRRRQSRTRKGNVSSSNNMSAVMKNIIARARSTNKSIAAAIGGKRRTRKNRKVLSKNVAMNAIKANKRLLHAASAAIGGTRK
jgi:hypothetical protein